MLNLKKSRQKIILAIIITLIIVFAVLTTIMIYFIKTTPISSRSIQYAGGFNAIIVLEKIEYSENNVTQYVEIIEYDLDQYPLLAVILDAYKNPNKYENATLFNNQRLIFNTTATEASGLTEFIQNKLYDKYSTPIRIPYYIKYNDEIYSYQVAVD